MIAPPLRNPRSIIGGQKSIAGQVPAPIAGMNATASLANMGPLDCVYTFNALAVDDGLVVRPGCIEWANGWDGGPAKTIIPFEGNTDADDKLFVANNLGIWDVTTAGEDNPTQVVTFASQAGNAGYGSYVNFTNDAGNRYLLVCDGENGYYIWEAATNTWAKAMEANNIENFAYDTASFSVATQTTSPAGLAFNDANGSQVYALDAAGDLHEYELPAPYDGSSATFVQTADLATLTSATAFTGIQFYQGGMKLLVLASDTQTIYQLDMTTSGDISTLSLVNSLDISSYAAAPSGIAVNSNVTKIFVTNNGNEVIEINLSVPGDVTTGTQGSILDISTQVTNAVSLGFIGDGSRLMVLDGTSAQIYQYNLTIDYLLSSATYSNEPVLNVSTEDTAPVGIAFGDGDAKLFVLGNTTDSAYQYSVDLSIPAIEGIDPNLFNFVMVWKNRVWFIERGSGRAWYLPVQQFAGDATPFEFSTQFASGGFLKSLYNWTLDGGAGIDDYIVAISSSGDTLIYQGTDPDDANAFGLRGVWNIGRPPEGSRIGKEFGGELYLLSIRGIVKASHLLQGQIDRPEAYLSNKVSPLFRRAVADSFDSPGWHLHAHPATSRLYTNTPLLNSGNYWGFSYYFGTGSWSMVRGLPKFYTENWQDRVYWVDAERNKIFYEGGNIDFVYLDPEVDGDPALIESVGLTAFSTLQNPGVNKRLQFIRPVFLSDRPANYRVEARYNYDLGEILQTPDVPSVVGPGIWNTGIWNANFWASDPSSSQQTRGGGTGMGTTVAIGYKFLSSGPTTLVSFDLAFDTGGFL